MLRSPPFGRNREISGILESRGLASSEKRRLATARTRIANVPDSYRKFTSRSRIAEGRKKGKYTYACARVSQRANESVLIQIRQSTAFAARVTAKSRRGGEG